jgi:uncharacterized protein
MHPGYMIPDRLPWRHRARPSATLHEIQVCSEEQTCLPSDIPSTFTRVTSSFDYIKRDVMIPMRDGVKLHTVIVVPKGAKGAPMLLTRTPYSATVQTSYCRKLPPRPDPRGYDNAGRGNRRRRLHPRGAGRARQVRLRGRLRHEPPAARAAEPDPVDHATDTYDTIDWLVKKRSREQRQGRASSAFPTTASRR